MRLKNVVIGVLYCIISAFVFTIITAIIVFVLSLFGIMDKPNFAQGVVFFCIMFIFFLFLSIYQTIVSMYHYKKDPLFRSAIDSRIIGSWKEWKEMKDKHPDWFDKQEPEV